MYFYFFLNATNCLMFGIKFLRSFTLIIICCLLSFSSYSFPKKKHSIIKEKIDRDKYENVFEAGYHFGYAEFCNFPVSDKNAFKRVKGAVAYTNWDLFLVFNKGFQDVNNTLVVAGVGWAGNQYATAGTTQWVQHAINWKFGLKDSCPDDSIQQAEDKMDDLIKNVILGFLLERDNFQSNYDSLIMALKGDKRDDYGSIIQKLNLASESYGNSPTTTIASDSSSNEESVTNVSIEENSSGENKTVKEKLKELKSLYDDELISEEDYNAKKQEILDNL